MARALYIHWPFCLAKCPYCDFNSHVRQKTDVSAWREALLADLRYEADRGNTGTLSSVFFGGGTPSLMDPALVSDLLAEAELLFGFGNDIEITFEANPTTVEAERFEAIAQAGVNRVSLGVQSFDDAALRFLGRTHGAEEARRALDIAQRSFERVSFDLIYARPDQSEAAWRAELGEALARGTEHLSLYQLTIEPGTRFATDVRRGALTPQDDDAAATLYDVTADMTRAAGLPTYEISNYARPGAESRHNLTYWRYEDYLGIGPGAHGRRGGVATLRHRKPENYLAAVTATGNGISSEQHLSTEDRMAEALLMGLRLREGIDAEAFAARFDRDRLFEERKLALHIANGLLRRDGARVAVTPKGMPLLDALLADIVADDLVAV